jgi:hypothetical protein
MGTNERRGRCDGSKRPYLSDVAEEVWAVPLSVGVSASLSRHPKYDPQVAPRCCPWTSPLGFPMDGAHILDISFTG